MTTRSKEFLAALEAYDQENNELALRLMEECAAQGDPLACYMAALWRKRGEGTAPNPEKSAMWLAKLEQLAEEGHPLAQWEIGQHYRFGDLLPLDVKRANHWLERAAESGYGEAQHQLAWFYETGQNGYPVDVGTAEIWYQRAFAQQHPETVYLFAIRKFQDGQPTEEAIALLKKSAELGFKQASEILRQFTH